MARSSALSEALLRRLIRAARAEGWTEVRLVTTAGDVVLSAGGAPAPVLGAREPDIDAELEAFDRGEL